MLTNITFRSYNLTSNPKSDGIFQGYIVFVPQIKIKNLQKLFLRFWKTFYILNVILITTKDNCIIIYTYEPFSDISCRTINIKILEIFCSKGEYKSFDVFPRKIENLYKCKVRGNAWCGDIKVMSFPHLESKTLQSFSKKLNFSFKVLKTGDFHQSYTAGNFDIIFGNYHNSEQRSKILSVSFPHDWHYIFMFLKRRQHMKTSWEILVEPFDWNLWLMLIICLIVGPILLSFFKKCSFINEFTTILCLLFGISTKLSAKRFNIKIQYYLWMFLGVIITSAHHAAYYNILQFKLYCSLPETLEEIKNQNISDNLLIPIALANGTEYFKNKTGMKVSVVRGFNIIPKILYGSKRSMGLTSLEMISNSEFDLESFHIIDDVVLTVYSVIFFEKHSFLVNPFNEMLINLYSGGILEKWKNDFFKSSIKEFKSYLSRNYRIQKFSFKQLSKAFEIWFVFLFLSSIILAGERICFNRRCQFKVNKGIKSFFEI